MLKKIPVVIQSAAAAISIFSGKTIKGDFPVIMRGYWKMDKRVPPSSRVTVLMVEAADFMIFPPKK